MSKVCIYSNIKVNFALFFVTETKEKIKNIKKYIK